ncbi:Hypothetical_protein [Hexamita inflata]|uniref:Hypothetical_protein n=2 Tax=Hexamita inflata TaxID=28002 RepID=A0AA86TLN4_9EUKA|nr:Hypothetical protein HINF_LOCUS8701 [Hexamita inflata]CAI9921057.1 Hypothetical protein HINF_LOCUS8702 [Hexamita inflata]CAI9969450.1 Hypothetical protein HINF_LOCUS57095 [Hexamita inflata]
MEQAAADSDIFCALVKQNRRVQAAFGSHSPANSPIRSHPDAALKAHAGQRQAARPGAGTRDALEMQSNCWFGHTTSSTPHLIPNCEVKSGQATSSTALGDYAGTGCAERFLFLAAPAFLPVAREEFQSAPAVFRSGEPSARLRGPESAERSTIWPWQKAREE